MPGNILVVDNAGLAQAALEQAGYHVTTAADGAELLAKVKADKPDMVVCDAMMPQIDGFDVVQKLKAETPTRSIPTVMLGGPSDSEVHRGWTSGADCYLTKPFDQAELLDFVGKLLQMGR
ncbi:MAG TPA: response regulator [Armatimonadota bacterium]|nr:response regulator [Armatimonadota bacterium]